MDISILLGISGIIISILFGLITFWIADKRSRQKLWHQAKETVLRELSKSLSENNIPDSEIISATIRSVLRECNSEELEAVTVDEILDELIRRITSDPFLDSNRRKKLQDEILAIKSKKAKEIRV